jgi:hypothetical protein
VKKFIYPGVNSLADGEEAQVAFAETEKIASFVEVTEG